MSQELRVLIIEDDPDVRLGCEQAMMLADLPVEGVGSAEEGLARLKPGFPGIVVTDIRMIGKTADHKFLLVIIGGKSLQPGYDRIHLLARICAFLPFGLKAAGKHRP